MKTISIKTPKGIRTIGPAHPAFIVAEMSANHTQKFERAVAIIKAAAKAGADAIKIQTYTPDTMTLNSRNKWFTVGGTEMPATWRQKNLYDLYQTAYTPWEWDAPLQKIAHQQGLVFFSTPFDIAAVDFLEKLKVPCYKIASYELTDIPLLERVAKTKKPVIISIGFGTKAEVTEAVRTLRKNAAKEIAVLHCVTSYSDTPRNTDMNLATMRDIEKRFNVVTGFSDNNLGVEIPTMAAAMGAHIIEKHVTVKRSWGGPDARFSLEPDELAHLVRSIRALEAAQGKPHYGPTNSAERENTFFRRSLFAVKDIKKGERFTRENVRVIRPRYGLAPKHYASVLQKRATRDIVAGTPLTWNMLS